MSVEWLSAIVVVALIAGVMWRSGASAFQITIVVGLALVAVLATALGWDALVGNDS